MRDGAFAMVLRATVLAGAAVGPMLAAFVYVTNWTIPAREAHLRQQHETSLASETKGLVVDEIGGCPQGTQACRHFALSVRLDDGQQTAVLWRYGKPYNSSIALWQKPNGAWTAKEPALKDAEGWQVYAIPAIAALISSAVLTGAALSVPRRTWEDMQPAFTAKGSKSAPTQNLNRATS